jgi:hypothetical protein
MTKRAFSSNLEFTYGQSCQKSSLANAPLEPREIIFSPPQPALFFPQAPWKKGNKCDIFTHFLILLNNQLVNWLSLRGPAK